MCQVAFEEKALETAVENAVEALKPWLQEF